MGRKSDALDELVREGQEGAAQAMPGPLAYDRDTDREDRGAHEVNLTLRVEDLERQLAEAGAAVNERAALIASAAPAGSLEELVASIPALSVGSRGELVMRAVRQRVTASEGRSAGASLARAITRQLDWVAGDADMTAGSSSREAMQEARCELAILLATRCAAALRAAADELDHYGPTAAAYARTKAEVDARLKRKERIPQGENLVAARRRDRETQRAKFGAALTGAWLAASGGEE